MMNDHEILISARDAQRLAPLRAACEALSDLLDEARLLPHEELPEDRIALDSKVLYEEQPGGERRAVALVHPQEAAAGDGRISVLSPVGLALLGRAPGAVVAAAMPGGRALTIRILGLENGVASWRASTARHRAGTPRRRASSNR